jgi:hypothetical protein
MLKDLERAIDKVKLLPVEQQQYAASVLEQIAAGSGETHELSSEERRLVREGLDDLDNGRSIAHTDMAEFWNRNRS